MAVEEGSFEQGDTKDRSGIRCIKLHLGGRIVGSWDKKSGIESRAFSFSKFIFGLNFQIIVCVLEKDNRRLGLYRPTVGPFRGIVGYCSLYIRGRLSVRGLRRKFFKTTGSQGLSFCY